MEVTTQVRWQAVDVAAEIEQRIARDLPRKRTNGGTDRVRFGPAPLASERLETLEVLLVEINLQGPGHEARRYALMRLPSTAS